jgi:drug/metabolite transporter (DMT)-like permease
LYIWYIALGSTTVGQVSAIFNTSCFFTYIFSLWILKQKSESRKLLAVVSSVLGILVITLEDTPWSFSDAENVGDLSTTDAAAVASHTASAGSSEGETGLVLSAMWANALLALSAVCYGLYEVIFAKYSTPSTTPDSADRNEMNGVTSSPSKRMDSSAHHHGEVEEESLFLANQIIGFIGLTTIFIWWIPLVILDQTGLERFGLPEDQHIWMLIGLDIVCSFIHNTLYMLTITLIGPVFASIGVCVKVFSESLILLLFIGDVNYTIRCFG